MKKLENKKCNCCGKIHTEVPSNARRMIDENILIGWFFECECGSTMFVREAV